MLCLHIVNNVIQCDQMTTYSHRITLSSHYANLFFLWCHIIILRYSHMMIVSKNELLHGNIVILPYFHVISIILLLSTNIGGINCNITILSYYHIIIYLNEQIIILLCYHVMILPQTCIVITSFCHIIILTSYQTVPFSSNHILKL